MLASVKPPSILFSVLPQLVWKMPSSENSVYLSFDDGPHPEATPFVLDSLKQYNAKATFFCIGKNVAAHPEIYHQLAGNGHAVGNHTYDHLNGWKTSREEYLQNIEKAAEVISSDLFRPPYGRITPAQVKQVSTRYKVYMWSLLSMDYAPRLTPGDVVKNVLDKITAGDIIVFHDSAKALPRLKHALPVILNELAQQGFNFKPLI